MVPLRIRRRHRQRQRQESRPRCWSGISRIGREFDLWSTRVIRSVPEPSSPAASSDTFKSIGVRGPYFSQPVAASQTSVSQTSHQVVDGARAAQLLLSPPPTNTLRWSSHSPRQEGTSRPSRSGVHRYDDEECVGGRLLQKRFDRVRSPGANCVLQRLRSLGLSRPWAAERVRRSDPKRPPESIARPEKRFIRACCGRR